MELEFKLAYCTTVHFKRIFKREVVIFLSFEKIKKKNAYPCKFQKKIKRAAVSFSEMCRSKIFMT